MNVIIPMAGMGKRLRPHTLTTPKPLLHIAGKPIVQRLVEDIVALSDQKIERIAYVTGQFGEEAESLLLHVAETLGARGSIHYQDEPLGTAHAILCASDALLGPVTVAFADTLFQADFKVDPSADGVLWVQQIDDPSQFGVVVVNESGIITDFVEKPAQYISDLAMIGIYYFRDGSRLNRELQFLIDNNIQNGGEYQLPDALRKMVNSGCRFAPGKVSDWMDCGNKDAMVETNTKVLRFRSEENQIPSTATIVRSKISPLSRIGNHCTITDSHIGDGVSIGDRCSIQGSDITNCLVGEQTQISQSKISNAMIGRFAVVEGLTGEVSLGDYSTIRCLN